MLRLTALAGLLFAVAACSSTADISSTAPANETCPFSGNPVDAEAFYEHEGTKIYVCCETCIEHAAKDPAAAMAKAYPDR